MATQRKQRFIAFVAGKSGGHIVPCLTLMQKKYSLSKVLFFTTDRTLDEKIIAPCSDYLTHIKLPLGFSYTRLASVFFTLVWTLPYSFVKSFWYLVKYRPYCVVTTGGLVAVPVCLAARILCIPIDVYNVDAIPGRANRFIASFATKVHVCFQSTLAYFNKKKSGIVEYPVRFSKKPEEYDSSAERNMLGLDPSMRTMLVLGGSQGSVSLNAMMKQLIESGLNTIQVIHQTGSTDSTDWDVFYKDHGIRAHVFSFNHSIDQLLAASDWVMCRAGAGTLFEVLYFKKKMLVIPLRDLAGDHQIANARAMQAMYPELVFVESDMNKIVTILTSKFITFL